MTKRLNTARSLTRLGLALSLAGLMTTAHAGLFEDDEARRAILDLRQRLEQTQGSIKSLGDENAALRRALLDFQTQIDIPHEPTREMRFWRNLAAAAGRYHSLLCVQAKWWGGEP